MDLRAIQQEVRKSRIDGWLFYDFHHRDPIANHVLGLEQRMATRRWYYFIPAEGEPRKLVHRIESWQLDSLPGRKLVYAAWSEHRALLGELLEGAATIAMQYSPLNAIPYVSMVDAGTVELVQSLGKTVVSSANLIQKFEARWSAEQLESHLAAGKSIDRIVQETFQQIGQRVKERGSTDEYAIQQWILEQFEANGLETDDPPIVAVNENSGNPHYEPAAQGSRAIRAGDFVLLDVWGKQKTPGAVYYDITWTGFVGASVPAHYREIFEIVREARDGAVDFVRQAVAAGRAIHGFEVDDAARQHIAAAGYGANFTHRTGHSIGQEVHSTGANMDNLETHDDREIISRTCFSIEPGIYLPEFGVRSEVNVFVDEKEARVTGPVQREIVRIPV